ncbi:MAG: DUF3108 domain-containing protein [Dechloromonas sp.]|nr:DUF3108 domain-containing protein [Dechloromonas sp.]
MPVALLAALFGSLAIHAAALVGIDVELFGGGPEPVPLRAEIRPLPAPPGAPPPVVAANPGPSAVARPARAPRLASASPAPKSLPVVDEPVPEAEAESEIVPGGKSTATMITPAQPPRPVLPTTGTIRFAIYKVSLALQVGRAEHRWEFSDDGRYRLTGITETSGLVSLFKPIRLETESVGRMVVGGLQPETYRTLKNGKDANENADFDWSTVEVRLARDGSVRPIAPGTQDLLSLNYQLAYMGQLAEGSMIGVVTGKKYERYALDSLGEEEIETPAGRFRTLHLRAMTDNTTEIWIALDRERLPVRIRFTDKKGESFEQVATEIGSP